MTTRHVGLAGIAVAALNRMRVLRPEKVHELAESMRERGLLQPIVIQPKEGTGYFLVAGRHRLAAAESLKWNAISANIVEGMDADQALLAEIDENLVRADLSPAETAAHQAKRAEIYKRQHPETKRGAAGGSATKAKSLAGGNKAKSQNGTQPSSAAYIDDAAAKTKRGRTTVAREITRGSHIPRITDIVGTSLDQGEELDALAKMPPAAQDPIITKAMSGERVSAKTELKKQVRAEREIELASATVEASKTLGKKLYSIIYADPPWRFEPYSRDTGMDRAADNHYPTETLEGICAMKVPAAKDCVLFLWATVPMLRESLAVMEAWGFDYKSHFAWIKDKPGTGYWGRNQHELLLIGTRGKVPAPAPGEQYNSVIHAKVGRHSEKPAAFAEMIDDMFPSSKGVELFARKPRLGWDTWGNEKNS